MAKLRILYSPLYRLRKPVMTALKLWALKATSSISSSPSVQISVTMSGAVAMKTVFDYPLKWFVECVKQWARNLSLFSACRCLIWLRAVALLKKLFNWVRPLSRRVPLLLTLELAGMRRRYRQSQPRCPEPLSLG